MPRTSSKPRQRVTTKPARRSRAARGRRVGMVGMVGGLGLLWTFGVAGCAAVVAGAAAGMLAARTDSTGEVDVSTPTVGESVDHFADSAGQVLARTIKERVPTTVRAVPSGKPKVTTTPRTPVIVREVDQDRHDETR